MKKYDYIFAGGGLSGTMLLYLFLQSELKNKSFLLIDKNLHKHPKRQWSFWLKRKSFLDNLITSEWNSFAANFSNESYICDLEKYRICLLESKKYYAFIEKELRNYTNVDYICENVLKIENDHHEAIVTTNRETYTGSYVFDSTYDKAKNNQTMLSMQGGSFEIYSDENIFNPTRMTLLDFQDSRPNELFFFYVLPLSKKNAFIETAHITTGGSYEKNYHEIKVQNYLAKHYLTNKYKGRLVDFGKIPLTDQKNKRWDGHRIQIGAKAGLLKSTTSYGLVNILKDSEYIVESFVKKNKPHRFYTSSKVHTFLDSAMLELIQTSPGTVKRMYADMFRYNTNTSDNFLAYLSEELPLLQCIRLLKNVESKEIGEIIKRKIMHRQY